MRGRLDSLLIVGASARFAAQSANRAGIPCSAVDLFADWDLCQIAKSRRVESLSNLDGEILSRWSDASYLMPTGGMENRTNQLKDLSNKFQIIGSSIAGTEKSNCPYQVKTICDSLGLRYPETRTSGRIGTLHLSNQWLLKPEFSAGGHRIRMLSGKDVGMIPDGFYCQELVAGVPVSGMFCSDGESTVLLGASRQLCGQMPFFGQANPFAYCGSIGPISINDRVAEKFLMAGEAFAKELELRGLFGIDWVVNGNDACLIEINPRLPASGEVFERAGVFHSAVECHVKACWERSLVSPHATTEMVGKAIVFNNGSEFVVERENFAQWIGGRDRGRLADIPNIGTRIPHGAPILTVFASGVATESILRDLKTIATTIRQSIKEARRITSSSG